MQLIGIVGRAGAGKDTAADYLVENYGYEKVSFAAILKKMLSSMGFQEPANRADKEKNIEGFDFSWRHAAQALGTEYGRVCLHPDIWIILTMRSLKMGGKYVVSDCRFKNEQDAIIAAGGTMINLYGREVDLGELASHPSEQLPIPSVYSHKIFNDKSVEHLYAAVRGIAEALEWQDNDGSV
jgi:hypothetical protein